MLRLLPDAQGEGRRDALEPDMAALNFINSLQLFWAVHRYAPLGVTDFPGQ